MTPLSGTTVFASRPPGLLDLRRFLYEQIRLPKASRVLEVGSGTGVITSELGHLVNGCVLGLDIDANRIAYAHTNDPHPLLTAGDALSLPFTSAAMDFTVCHFLLLWVKEPLLALQEMRRVTRPGGAILALAEPDYGGRIDHPAPLVELGRLQAQSIARQGANPNLGRRLSELFHRAGLARVQTGILGGQWSVPPTVEAWESEWETLESDLAGILTQEKLVELRRTDQAAWQHGERVLFVPTFYAYGYVE